MRTIPQRRGHRWQAAIAAAAAVLVAASAGAVSPAAAAETDTTIVGEMTPALHDEIQARVDAFRTEHVISGISMAVVTPQRGSTEPVITTFHAGFPTIGSATPVDDATQFELGSETKEFTADLLADLLATGAVTLDDTLQQHAPDGVQVPEWPATDTSPARPILLRDLATHSAGLPDDPFNTGAGCEGVSDCDNWRPGYTQTDLWEGIDQSEQQQPILLWEPGTRWFYSNWGYALLGAVLSNVAEGVPPGDQKPAYQSALDDSFLTPLGLSATVLEESDTDPATPYTAPSTGYPEGKEIWRWDNTNAFSGAGGLISNATDMGRWVAAHLGHIPADAPLGVRTMADTLQQVGTVTEQCGTNPMTGQIECGKPQLQSGLGWQLYPEGWSDVGAPYAFKNGGTQGSSSDTVIASSVGVGVTEMFNQYSDGAYGLSTQILALLVPAHREPPRPILPATGASGPGPAVPLVVGGALLLVGALLTVRRRRSGDIR